ncbi:MAG: alpha/beta hydrolase [Deltaproteobacteria bacterium]|nr:alpha/beta hydrolase [Deltaproteobacteria bacterium]
MLQALAACEKATRSGPWKGMSQARDGRTREHPRRPLVLIPALGGSEELLAPFVAALSSSLEVTVLEPPGFGDAPSPVGAPSTRTLARAALELWDEEGLGRADLFGISLGGMVAQWMALEAPDRIGRLVLASTTDLGLRALAGAGLRELAMARCLLLPEGDAMACLTAEVLDDGPAASPEVEAQAEHAARAHPRSKGDLLWLTAAAAAHDTRSELADLETHTLVLSGEADGLIPLDDQRAMAARLPHAHHITLSELGHDITLESPERTAATVLDFLAPPPPR